MSNNRRLAGSSRTEATHERSFAREETWPKGQESGILPFWTIWIREESSCWEHRQNHPSPPFSSMKGKFGLILKYPTFMLVIRNKLGGHLLLANSSNCWWSVYPYVSKISFISVPHHALQKFRKDLNLHWELKLSGQNICYENPPLIMMKWLSIPRLKYITKSQL